MSDFDFSSKRTTPDYSQFLQAAQQRSQVPSPFNNALQALAPLVGQIIQKQKQQAQQQKMQDWLKAQQASSQNNPQIQSLYSGLASAPPEIQQAALPKIFEQGFKGGAGNAKPQGSYWLNPEDPTQVSATPQPGWLKYTTTQADAGAKLSTAARANQREKTFERFATVREGSLDLSKNRAAFGGQFGKSQLSLNTALGHVGTAIKAYDAVNNMDVKALNTPISVLKRQGNDPNIIALGISLNALKGELSNVFKATGATDREIASWQEYLNENLTPIQAKAALAQIGDLLNSRLSALQFQQNKVVPGLANDGDTLSPKAKNTLQSLISGNKPTDAGGWAIEPVK